MLNQDSARALGVSLLLLSSTSAWAQPQHAVNAGMQGCDTARAIGHVKRITGSAADIFLERASGSIVRRPAALTPICQTDRLRVRNNGIVVIDLYQNAPITVTKAATWTAPSITRQASLSSNVWAFFVDKIAPDVGRTQSQNRTRGVSLLPVPLIAGVSNGTAQLNQDDLGDVIFIPLAGITGVTRVQLQSTTQVNPPPIIGQRLPQKANEASDNTLFSFSSHALLIGRYRMTATLAVAAGNSSTRREMELGSFTLVAGKAPTLQTSSAQSPYNSDTVLSLQALWLAQTQAEQSGLMAYQLSRRVQGASVPSIVVQRLVLSYAKAP